MFKSIEAQLAPDLRVRITMLPAGQGMPLYFRLLKHFAAFVGQASGAMEGAKEAEFETKLLPVLAGLLQTPALASDLEVLVAGFRPSTVVLLQSDGSEVPLSEMFEGIFAGRYHLIVQWLFHCAKLNFGASFLALATKGAGSAASTPAA